MGKNLPNKWKTLYLSTIETYHKLPIKMRTVTVIMTVNMMTTIHQILQ